MKEYNKLTQRLLAEGYTAEHHPAWVSVPVHYGLKDPLSNWEGGFVYNWKELPNATFKTPCGLYVKRENLLGNMSWMGVDWSYENDLATIYCPFRKYGCERIHPILRENIQKGFPYCNAAFTNETWQEERSVEHFKHIAERWEHELLEEFKESRKGRWCLLHMRYDPDEEKWSMRKYDPQTCGSWCKYCQYLGIPLDTKKGNVFYDIRISRTYNHEKGTLFEGTVHTNVIRGKKRFKKPMSMTICENYAKLCRHDLEHLVMSSLHAEMFMTKAAGGVYEWSVENIRAAQKESRDIHQDLADIRAGITVVHENDQIADTKAQKKARKLLRIEKRKSALRKNFIQGKELSYSDIRFIEKYVTDDESEEWNQARERTLEEKANEPVQMSLFDLML